MVKKLGICLIVFSIVLAFVTKQFVLPVILNVLGWGLLYLSWIGKDTFKFTEIISKYPDDAYDWFVSNEACWKTFEDHLPEGYKDKIPTKTMKPLRLFVPKLGNKLIYVFGKFPECRQSEKEFLSHIEKKKAR